MANTLTASVRVTETELTPSVTASVTVYAPFVSGSVKSLSPSPLRSVLFPAESTIVHENVTASGAAPITEPANVACASSSTPSVVTLKLQASPVATNS